MGSTKGTSIENRETGAGEITAKSPPNVDRRAAALRILLLIAVTTACLAPFAGKAFGVDDPLFIWSAKHIQSHFADPYGFDINWYGKTQPMWMVAKNPPLASYYMALGAFVVGWSEAALHIMFLIPAIAVTLGIYFLAAKFCSRPFEAALAAILTPVFLLSATTVMCDVMMLAFWVWAMYLWVRGTENNRHGLLALSMLLVALSALTKYFGIALIPLLAAYSITSKKRPSWAAHLLIPVVILAVYQIATKSLYGHGLLSDAWQYSAYYHANAPARGLSMPITGFIFTGGCILTALFCAPLLWNRRGLTIGMVIAGLAFLLFLFKLPGSLKADTGVALQAALLFTGGTAVLVLAVQGYLARRDPPSLTLLLWVAGTFVFASLLNWSVNGRSILPMAPAAGILVMRQMELRKNLSWYVYLPLALAAFASVFINCADYQLAANARKAADQITDSYGGEGRTIWFEGHWGFQYYMEKKGAKPIAFKGFAPQSGDIVVVPTNNTNVLIENPGVPPLEVLTFESPLRLATMVKSAGAGFYSDAYGPLPFRICSVPAEYYGVFEAP